jgi:hypothetical protein
MVRHKDFLSVPYIVCTYIDVQKYVTKKENPPDVTPWSYTRLEWAVCVLLSAGVH